jgi:hypothetical protein
MFQIIALGVLILVIVLLIVFRKLIFKSFSEINQYAESLVDDDKSQSQPNQKETKDE